MKRLTAALLLLLLLAGCAAPAGPASSEIPEVSTAPEVSTVPTAPEISTVPEVPEAVSPVYTDWSKLTPYEPVLPVYTLHPGYCGDGALEARDDYGPLLPYIGKYSTMERYVIDTLPLYGLVTGEGELVTDPVYAQISLCDGFLVLYRGDPEGTSGGDTFDGGTFSRTLAAADGRWVHELTGSYYVASGSGLLLTAAADGSLDLWNTDGEVAAHFDSGLFTPWFGEGFTWGGEGGASVDWTDDRVGYVVSYCVNGEYQDQATCLYLDFSGGAVMETPPEGYSAEIDYSAVVDKTPAPPAVEGCRYLDPITDQVTGETYFYGYYREDEDEDGRYALFDREGRLLVETGELLRFNQSVIVRAGLCSTVEDGCFCFRSVADSALVFRYPMRTNSD